MYTSLQQNFHIYFNTYLFKILFFKLEEIGLGYSNEIIFFLYKNKVHLFIFPYVNKKSLPIIIIKSASHENEKYIYWCLHNKLYYQQRHLTCNDINFEISSKEAFMIR